MSNDPDRIVDPTVCTNCGDAYERLDDPFVGCSSCDDCCAHDHARAFLLGGEIWCGGCCKQRHSGVVELLPPQVEGVPCIRCWRVYRHARGWEKDATTDALRAKFKAIESELVKGVRGYKFEVGSAEEFYAKIAKPRREPKQ